jgi:transcriptional regulator with XRE-family HTH domain
MTMRGQIDPIDVRVGGRMRDRRREIGLSQEKLGAAIGVTFQQVQKYENARNRLSASALFRVAKALGVEVAFFFEGCGGAP